MTYLNDLDIFHKKCAEQNIENICTHSELANYPVSEDGTNGRQTPTHNWVIKKNKGDGHCFYHAVMQFLSPSLDYNHQKASNVYRLRKAVMPFIRNLSFNNNTSVDEVFFKNASLI